jgi:hypothetical protein
MRFGAQFLPDCSSVSCLAPVVDNPVPPRLAFWHLLGLSLVLVATLNAQTLSVTFQSREQQTALLELFTSEGCSSCPPAETWLSSLKAAPGLWKDFVPVAFHVDYWDRLGWRDPWDAKEFADRQRAYAASWGNTSIYTPGFVLNGEESRAWSGLKDRLRPSGHQAGVLKVVSSDPSLWQVRFKPPSPSQPVYEAYAALLVSGVTSDVKAGENRGRRLLHDFVVTTLVKSPLRTDRGGVAWGQIVLNKAVRGQQGQPALAVWVTLRGRTEPLQAVGGWLR